MSAGEDILVLPFISMKRLFLVSFSCIILSILCFALLLFLLYSQKDKAPLGNNTQEAVQLIHRQNPLLAGRYLLRTPFVQRLLSSDRSTLLRFFSQGIEQQIQNSSRSIVPQHLIPQHALLVMELADAAATGENFLDSSFGKTFTSINWPVVLQRLNIKRSLYRSLEQNALGLMDLLTHPDFAQFFHQPLFIAQLPAFSSVMLIQGGEKQGKQRHPLLEHLLVVMDTDQEDAEAMFAALLGMFPGGRTTQKYFGFTVYTIQSLERQKRYIALVGGKIILSFAQQPMQESIALFLKNFFKQQNQQPKDLLLNPEYTRLKRERPEQTNFFLYADLFRVKLYCKALFAHFNAQNSAKKGSQPNIGHPWQPGVRSLGFYHYSRENRENREQLKEQFKMVVRFSQEQLYPFQRHIYSTVPMLNQSFHKVPDDLLLSFWFNWMELSLWWKTTIAAGKKEELAAAGRIAAWIKEKTDLEMEQFLALFGKRVSIHIADISTAGFFPVPRLCLSVEILNRKKMDKFFQKIIANLPVKRTMVGGVPVVSLLAAQGMLQPSYAFLNGHLLLADSKEQIEDILLKRKTPLSEGKEFQAVDIQLDTPANLQLFARTPEMINAMQELASWAGTMVAVRDHKAGAMSKRLIDQIISPLLESLKVYQAIGIRSATAPDKLVIEGTVLRAEEKE
ncbi:MAG: hypothetical protein D3907_06880 [Candidatus Electrothrix sp. AUS3]|nr:hypothetical protein [Candidatus Electrothrix gigas]